jgi:hypothetical protein
MFTYFHFVHIRVKLIVELEMAITKPQIVHKHFRLDTMKLKRAQRALRATTETEAVERALDLVISEHERNRITAVATRSFLASGVVIRDVYRSLEA